MLYRLRQTAMRWWFAARCRRILSTPPLHKQASSLCIVSMVSHQDVVMYLHAIKSLQARLPPAEIVVLNDASITPRDLELLQAHVSPSRFLSIREIDCGPCPRGGTWERLMLISELVRNHYVIQLDSDTLTLGAVPEVASAIHEQRSFTLGTSMGREIRRSQDVCRQMKTYKAAHVQIMAEQNFDRLSACDELNYVRGCSGFAGFAQGSFSRIGLEAFSMDMRNILGAVWENWGSEQVASNMMIANSPQAFVLPYPKYCNFTPQNALDRNSFLHFIGTYRFKGGTYIQKANAVAAELAARG